MVPSKFEELLARARANAAAAKETNSVANADSIKEQMKGVHDVDLSKAGITDETLRTEEGREQAIETIGEIIGSGTEYDRDTDDKSNTHVDTQGIKDRENINRSGDMSKEDSGDTETISTIKEYHKPGVAKDVILNDKQQLACDKVLNGESVVLIGSAGTGKTTATGQTTRRLISSGKIGKITSPTKWLQVGKPGIVIVAYTRKAVNNIRYAVDPELKAHTITIHKLIEFAPVKYEIEDPENPGYFKTTMRFEPKRNHTNPLPPELKLIVHEESSMESVELNHQLEEALPHKHQELYLGDIQQLPPIFGLAILGFKMLELPVIELTEVYRQALESPIIELAWHILRGNKDVFSPRTERYKTFSPAVGREIEKLRVPALDVLSKETTKGKTFIQIWQKRLSSDVGCDSFAKQVTVWIDQGYYNHEEDIILCPFNKAFGTVEINKSISQYLGVRRQAVVYEVIAGFVKHYLAVGDRVLYDKEDAVITSIEKNGAYLGNIKPAIPSAELDRWGHQKRNYTAAEMEAVASGNTDDLDIDEFFKNINEEGEERVQAASHVVGIKLTYSDEGEERKLDSASEVNALLGGYAITVHKSQGSEYNKVILVLHNTHANMVSRELLYTAITRAKTNLHIICEVDTLYKGVQQQRIVGNTIVEKAKFFQGKEATYNKMKEELEDKKKMALEFRPDAGGKVSKPSTVISDSDIDGYGYDKSPVVRLEDLIPEPIKVLIQNNLEKLWDKATDIWGADTIGMRPLLDYNLKSGRILGRAKLKTSVIQLNPVWCALAETDIQVKEEMTYVTLAHEICHLVAWHFSKDKGHGPGWKMAMKLMGLPPDRLYEGGALPSYMESKEKLMREFLEEKNVDQSEFDTETVTEDDVA